MEKKKVYQQTAIDAGSVACSGCAKQFGTYDEFDAHLYASIECAAVFFDESS